MEFYSLDADGPINLYLLKLQEKKKIVNIITTSTVTMDIATKRGSQHGPVLNTAVIITEDKPDLTQEPAQN